MNINLAIAERARAGETLTVAEIDELGSSDILSLGMLADEVRRARVGDSVTFGRVLGITGADQAGAVLDCRELPAANVRARQEALALPPQFQRADDPQKRALCLTSQVQPANLTHRC